MLLYFSYITRFIKAFWVSSRYLIKAGFTVTEKEMTAQLALQSSFAVGVLVGGKGAALGIGAEVGAEVDAEDNIAIASVRFKLAVESNIYLELIEKVRILLRI